MDQATADRVREQIDWERKRTARPAEFPDLPPIPTGRYVDPEFFALEQARLWKRSWLYVAREEELAEPGSFVTTNKTRSPLLLVRGKDHRVRAFFNTCQHRGAPVVREERGTSQSLRCQYHSWTYDLCGELVGVPERRDFTEAYIARRRLKELRCESYGGWIFVNEDLEATPLREWMGPVAADWECLHGASLRVIAERKERVPCNWKIAADAFLETYHVAIIHTKTVARLLDGSGTAIGLFRDGHSRMVTPKWPQALADRAQQRSAVRSFPNLDRIFGEANVAYALFPNLITPLDTIGFPFIRFWPVDIETTDVEWTWYALAPETDQERNAWEPILRVFDAVMQEDFANLAPMQRSVASGALASIPLGYQERRIYHLHEQIDRLIGEDRIPAPLRVARRLGGVLER